MINKIICGKCHGNGFLYNYEENRAWSEMCDMCKGTGTLGDIVIDDKDMITITKQEYEELLEYKSMYERLCI
jgi:hypothetical protein